MERYTEEVANLDPEAKRALTKQRTKQKAALEARRKLKAEAKAAAKAAAAPADAADKVRHPPDQDQAAPIRARGANIYCYLNITT